MLPGKTHLGFSTVPNVFPDEFQCHWSVTTASLFYRQGFPNDRDKHHDFSEQQKKLYRSENWHIFQQALQDYKPYCKQGLF